MPGLSPYDVALACLENGVFAESLEKKIANNLEVLKPGYAGGVEYEAKAVLYSVISFLANTGHFESAVAISSVVYSRTNGMTNPLHAMTAAIRMNSLIETGDLLAAEELFRALRLSSVKMSERAYPLYLNNIGIAARFFEPNFALNCFQEALEVSKETYSRAMVKGNLLFFIYAVGNELDDSLFVSDYDPAFVTQAIDDLRLLCLLEKSSASRQRAVAERMKTTNQKDPVRQNSVQTHAYLGHYYLETGDVALAQQELLETIRILNKQFSVFRFGEAAFLASRIYYSTGSLARSLISLLVARECLESNRLFCRFHKHFYRKVIEGLEDQLIGSAEETSGADTLSFEKLVSRLLQAATAENVEDRTFLAEQLWSELLTRESSTVHLIPALSKQIMSGMSKGFAAILRGDSVSKDDILAKLPDDSDFLEPGALERLSALVEALPALEKLR